MNGGKGGPLLAQSSCISGVQQQSLEELEDDDHEEMSSKAM